MTIGGIRIREKQLEALIQIQAQGQVALRNVNLRTASSLMEHGWIEEFVPDATSYSMAARGRMRYYRLTAAGKAGFNTIKKRYPKKFTTEVAQ